MLRHRWYPEVSENQDKNENVVDAKRILDHVAGKEFERLFRSPDFPNHQVEQEGENNPNERAVCGRAHAELAPPMLELHEIKGERNEHSGVKGDPKPNTCVRHRA
jgi:hypothetical protein